MVKKLSALLIALLMVFSAVSLAEEAVEPAAAAVYDHFTVGTITDFEGNFFTDMWGNSTADADVRALIHGYNLIRWQPENATYSVDDTVVTGISGTENTTTGNRTWRIALAEDLMYSDGTPITAWDYAFSLLLSVAPEMAEIGAITDAHDYIVGVPEYRAGEAATIAGIRVESDYTLTITINGEYLPFFYEMALLNAAPYPISAIAPGCEMADDGEGIYIRNAADENGNVPEAPVFTAELLKTTILDAETGYRSHPAVVSGPYVLTSYDADNSVCEFALNTYNKGNYNGVTATIPNLTYKYVRESRSADALRNGDVDLLHKCVSASTISDGMALLSEAETVTNLSVSYPRSGFSFISYNCEKPTVSSQAVRQAIAYCFDKQGFVDATIAPYGLTADGYYGMGQWMYQIIAGSLPAPIPEPAADASAEELAKIEEETAAYAALTLDNVKTYAQDTAAAVALLEEDGWTLNLDGEAFDPEKDEVRCKSIDETLVPLDISMRYYEGSALDEAFTASLVEPLAEVGVKLTLKPTAGRELFSIYYRNQERDCEMMFLATNFSTVYDPSTTFDPADAETGETNRTGIADEQLYKLASDMSATEPGDTLTYLQRWQAFEEYFSEVLPVIPVYSNVYFDFYSATLHDYNINDGMTWSEAIIGAYLGDYVEEATEEDTLDETDSGVVTF